MNLLYKNYDFFFNETLWYFKMKFMICFFAWKQFIIFYDLIFVCVFSFFNDNFNVFFCFFLFCF